MAIIEYQGVEILRKEHVVLKNVTFSIDKGQMVYLVGKVGSGKSSLLKTMYGEVPITTGSARVYDYDLRSIRRRDIPKLRRRTGIVFQDFQLLMDRNVYANLDFVLAATGWRSKADKEQRIEEVLRQVGMQNKSYKMPHELSGGEQQRIVIARALLNNPDIILADEPTGNLDPETAEDIIRLLREISQTGTSVVMSTHNLPLLDKYPGIVYRCADGNLEEVTNDYNKIKMEFD